MCVCVYVFTWDKQDLSNKFLGDLAVHGIMATHIKYFIISNNFIYISVAIPCTHLGFAIERVPNLSQACFIARVGDLASGEGAAVMGTLGAMLSVAGHAEKGYY